MNEPKGNQAQVERTGIPMRRILIAEDDEIVCRQLKKVLEMDDGRQVDTVKEGKEAFDILSHGPHAYSVFLTDLKMPGMDGIELIEKLRQQQHSATVIVMTGYGSIEQAVQAMRLGACDFLTKPIDPDHLRLVVQRALRERELQDEVLYLREQLQDRFAFHNIISKSQRMLGIFDLIGNVAGTDATVLIEGPTGTGKEMVARAIHQLSSQIRSGPFVPINCAALPETLLESELFGHEKGSFTGAVNQRQGRFEMADGGTLFLDEIGEISPAVQAKLLRVLQEHRFERVGGAKSIDVNVRVITATNRRLAKLVKSGQFREDLYYRVNVMRIELPRLRERLEDIPLLATHFSAKYSEPTAKKIDPEAMAALLQYSWPGNIRQLENAIERACVVARGDTIQPRDLPPELLTPRKPKPSYQVDLSRPLPEFIQELVASAEKQYIEQALKKTAGNVSRCAKQCGISRRSLTTKIGDYRIDRKLAQQE